MAKNKEELQFRFYSIPYGEQALALLGENWIRPYGVGGGQHFHNYTEIGLCNYGHGDMKFKGKRYPFGDKYITVIPPYYPHDTLSASGTKSYWEWIYIDVPGIVEKMENDLQETEDADQVVAEISREPLLFRETEHPRLAQLLYLLRAEYEEPFYMHTEFVGGILQAITAELFRIQHVEDEVERKRKRSLMIEPAIQYVQKHYAEQIKMKQLADECYISESHFRRRFQEYMNMSPGEYVNLVRIRQSCVLMEKTDVSMEEVAYRTGFVNVSTFNRNFKRLLNTTPYQWKKSESNYKGQVLDFHISALKGW